MVTFRLIINAGISKIKVYNLQHLVLKDNGYSIDFLTECKHSRKDRQVKLSFRELKTQIYWPTTDQRVRGSNLRLNIFLIKIISRIKRIILNKWIINNSYSLVSSIFLENLHTETSIVI